LAISLEKKKILFQNLQSISNQKLFKLTSFIEKLIKKMQSTSIKKSQNWLILSSALKRKEDYLNFLLKMHLSNGQQS